ncbi:hypothetical protein QAD02_002880 [Eretmocerus hayati]|uniref:Uncharacterized protein n=1 Tax=Eretmocerus hayati TaxID=131215 RepID=A0ACC2NLX8_9HYME|nr:hypothetical protein QAD02_002880 [Eretmocerus hayati]
MAEDVSGTRLQVEADLDQAAEEYARHIANCSFTVGARIITLMNCSLVFKEETSPCTQILEINFYARDSAVANLPSAEVGHRCEKNNKISFQHTFVPDKAHEGAEGEMISTPNSRLQASSQGNVRITL